MALDTQLIQSLESFGTVLNHEISPSDEAAAVRREREVERLQHHLDHARQNSFLLVGPSGCGKSTILRQLIKQAGGRRNKPWIFLETSSSLILAGTRYLGEWQTRIHDLLDVARRDQRVAIICTDVASLSMAGRSSASDENMAAVFGPAIESGDVVLIGECTDESYRQGIERFPWFKKSFAVFPVEPLDDTDTREVVRELAERHAQELGVHRDVWLKFNDDALAAVQQFGTLYFPGTASPGGAAQLLDHLVNQHRRETPKKTTHVEVSYGDVVQALASFTGVPRRLLDDSIPLTPKEIRDFFERRVIGQKEGVDAVVDLIALIKAGLTDPQKPLGVMLFVGPTGVGKTELAKALAEFIFGSQDRMLRFDMSEFKDYSSFEKLIGAPHFDEHSAMRSGSLLGRIRQQPFSVILLDEIEKAHTNIFDLLLQLFDDGRLSDAAGNTTNFTQSIIIMTSNLGGEIHEGQPFGFGNEPQPIEHSVSEALHDFFRPELLNRIDRIVHFQPLQREHVRRLAQRELGQVLLRSGITRRQMRVDVDPGVIDILADVGFHPAFGARPLKRAVERLALLPIARHLIQNTGDNRPALMRLLPGGDRIVLRIVHDRQSRKSESLISGATVVDPGDGKKRKLTKAQIEQLAGDLDDRIAQLEKICERRKLAELKSQLVEQTTRVDFWDDPPAARDVLSDLYRAERLLDAVQRIHTRSEQLRSQLETALKHRDQQRLKTVAQRLAGALQHAEIVRYSLECRRREDRCDVFVAIHTVNEPPEDLAGHLADMYQGWARRKGFEAAVVHEQLYEGNRISREITLLIEGVAIYGLLQGEDGIHEFIYGKTSKEPRSNHFVNVRVLPIVEDSEPGLDPAEVNFEKRKSRGKGLRAETYRSQIQATHRGSQQSIMLHSPQSIDRAVDTALDLLRAERHRFASTRDAAPDVHVTSERVVRKYTLRPTQSAKDQATRVTTHHLKELWKGDLDEFLTAALKARTRDD